MPHPKEELGAIAARIHMLMPEDLLPFEITTVINDMLKLRGIRCKKLVIEKIVGASKVQYISKP